MEELDISGALARFSSYSLSPFERVLLGHTGTVQLLLSLYFGSPVTVKVLQQSQDNAEIKRHSSLVVSSSGREICSAYSVIPLNLNRRDIVSDILEKKLGIGQIAAKHRVAASREINKITVSNSEISRAYTLIGSEMQVSVVESFHRDYLRAGS